MCDRASSVSSKASTGVAVAVDSEGTDVASEAAQELARYIRSLTKNATMYDVFVAVVKVTVERPIMMSYHATKGNQMFTLYLL